MQDLPSLRRTMRHCIEQSKCEDSKCTWPTKTNRKQTVLEQREGDIDLNNISIVWKYVAFLGYQDLIGNRRCGLKLSFQGSERLSSKFFCIVCSHVYNCLQQFLMLSAHVLNLQQYFTILQADTAESSQADWQREDLQLGKVQAPHSWVDHGAVWKPGCFSTNGISQFVIVVRDVSGWEEWSLWRRLYSWS